MLLEPGSAAEAGAFEYMATGILQAPLMQSKVEFAGFTGSKWK